MSRPDPNNSHATLVVPVAALLALNVLLQVMLYTLMTPSALAAQGVVEGLGILALAWPAFIYGAVGLALWAIILLLGRVSLCVVHLSGIAAP